MPDQRCGTCQYFDPVEGADYGLCFCPLPPLPLAVSCESEPMRADEGEHCKCWKAKETHDE